MMRVLAASFQKFPAGAWAPSTASLDGVIHLGAACSPLGLRLAMPVIGLLLLIDFALALLGRMQQQLQLLSLAFPVKMLAALGAAGGYARAGDGAALRRLRRADHGRAVACGEVPNSCRRRADRKTN